MIDLYCERTAAGLWAEPLNAVTNLGFLLVAFAIWRTGTPRGQADVRLFVALLAAIGIGSGLFHTFATPWAQWLDVLPILLFQLAFLACYLARVTHLAIPRVVAATTAFLLTALGAAQAREVLNGSLGYLPALLVLAWLGHDAWRRAGVRRHAGAPRQFVGARKARTADQARSPAR
ncbi:MAG: ceramidase domain-containing protein, partial [Gammaproteobacteria bacterium]